MNSLEGKHRKPIHFAGSIVLGMNDAIVEITGALAGMAMVFADTKTVLLAGSVTGIAAGLSMAAAEYLESKQDLANGMDKHPLTSAAITGGTYLLVTFLLLLPFAFISIPHYAIAGTILMNICIIAGFSYFVSHVRKQSFFKQFRELFLISMGVVLVSFLIGQGIHTYLLA